MIRYLFYLSPAILFVVYTIISIIERVIENQEEEKKL